MLSFKSFLIEMGKYLSSVEDKGSELSRVDYDSRNFKKHSDLSHGELHHKIIDGDHHWAVKENGEEKMRLITKANGNNHHIAWVSAKQGNKTKAHELYHHLITKHNINLASASQSPGGFKSWQKLHQKGGIKLSTVDMYSGEHKAVHHLNHPEDVHMISGNHKTYDNANKMLIVSKK